MLPPAAVPFIRTAACLRVAPPSPRRSRTSPSHTVLYSSDRRHPSRRRRRGQLVAVSSTSPRRCHHWYPLLYISPPLILSFSKLLANWVLFQAAAFVSFLLISHGCCIMCESLSLNERHSTATLACVFYLTLVGYKACVPYFSEMDAATFKEFSSHEWHIDVEANEESKVITKAFAMKDNPNVLTVVTVWAPVFAVKAGSFFNNTHKS